MMTNASPFFDTPSLRDAIANIKTEIPSESPLLTPVSSSSRRRKGNPRKCAQTTIGTSIESPACSSSSSNTSTDSGFSSAIAFNSFLASFSAASTSEVNQIQAVLQDLEQASALSMLTTNAPTGLSSTVSSAPNTPLILNDFTSALTKKPRVKASRRVSEDPASVTLPEGFEAILEKARSDGSTTATPHGLPPYAYTPRSDSGDGLILGLKRKRDNRSDTKITLQGPDGNIIEEHYEAEELQSFVKQFKVLRNKYGFTQGDVGAALGRRYGADFSQTTISRFEALNLSYKNMCKLRPLLEEWLEEVEQALEAGTPMTELLSRSFGANTFATTAGSSESIGSNGNTDDQCSISPNNRISPVVSAPSVAKLGVTKIMPPLKKRRKRTNLDASQKLALDEFFLRNPRPDFAQITEIGTNLKLDNDVVRVWFCNRRQKMRRIDPVKSESPPLP